MYELRFRLSRRRFIVRQAPYLPCEGRRIGDGCFAEKVVRAFDSEPDDGRRGGWRQRRRRRRRPPHPFGELSRIVEGHFY